MHINHSEGPIKNIFEPKIYLRKRRLEKDGRNISIATHLAVGVYYRCALNDGLHVYVCLCVYEKENDAGTELN